jgi:cold shock protein
MPTGKVKWFDPAKGFGFILPDDDDGLDVFVHISAVTWAGLDKLHEGDRVSYDVKVNATGKSVATNIALLAHGNTAT